MASGLADKCYDSKLVSWARNAVQACPSKKNMMFKMGLPRFQPDCPDFLEILAINLQSSFRSPSFGRWCLIGWGHWRQCPKFRLPTVGLHNSRNQQEGEPYYHGTMAYRSATMDPLVPTPYQESHQGWRSMGQLEATFWTSKNQTRFLSNQGHVHVPK